MVGGLDIGVDGLIAISRGRKRAQREIFSGWEREEAVEV